MASSSAFDLSVPGVRIVYGPGTLAQAGDEMARLESKRALVVCGRSIAEKTAALDILARSLGQRYAGAFTGVVYALGQRRQARDVLAAQIRETRADLLISVGGGIAIGTARTARTHVIGNTIDPTKLPMVCVPTTLSAAEANVAYVPVNGRRVNDPGSRPVTAILDSELACYTPADLFGSSGFNAINHCIEGIYSTASHPFADAFYLQALRLLTDHLPAAVADSNDVEARGKALLGGYMSGLMIESTWLGIGHALCHGLQNVYGTPHGMNNTVMVTRGMAYNLEVAAERMAAAAPGLGVLPGPDPRETALRCIDRVASLRRRMGLPERLRDLSGIDPARFSEAAEIALHDFFTSYNPRRPAGIEELVQVYKEAW